ncbi:DUF2871 domain-containing protein [Nocardia sp. 2]|uniref:DUF2871 domain-containing protein n=1 Tax=Nocardia acididurans TaxID=2802282 RepID=A0ABS1MIH7_9NOCA|nr:DUF2871 domain-containing protein [Nocardia acididurans]MBL1079860.1 DUF2871 domain-containing protein [Nocardia acididurans]
MRMIYNAAHVYMIAGLISGLFYREFTSLNDFDGETQLSVVHTHLLALGMLFHLILLALEKSFRLTASPLFAWSFRTYNAGVALTVGIMILHGIQQVRGVETGAATAGLAGLGHIVLTVGLILFFINLGKRVA